jgi:hypothetical protein
MPRRKSNQNWFLQFLGDNGLLLAFLALFAACVLGQMVSGVSLYNQTQRGLATISLGHYIRTGDFLQGMFENWQAAILQLAMLVLLGVFLKQKGAPHSRRFRASDQDASSRRPLLGRRRSSLRRQPNDSGGSFFRRNSLSVVFWSLFAVAFTLHALTTHAAWSSQLAIEHQPAVTFGSYLFSAKFWFLTMQTWEAEFFAIALYLLLSIFFRQQGSPESKPTGASDEDTGDANQ